MPDQFDMKMTQDKAWTARLQQMLKVVHEAIDRKECRIAACQFDQAAAMRDALDVFHREVQRPWTSCNRPTAGTSTCWTRPRPKTSTFRSGRMQLPERQHLHSSYETEAGTVNSIYKANSQWAVAINVNKDANTCERVEKCKTLNKAINTARGE